MKTKEELNAQKEEVETVSRKLHELTEEELAQVSGGFNHGDIMWDAACTLCRAAIGGAGILQFTESRADEKVVAYNKDGCPNCYAKNAMKKIQGTLNLNTGKID